MAARDGIGELEAGGDPALEPLLSIRDVTRVLRISESGIYRLMRAGDLPAVRLGGRTLFSPDAVRRLIASRTALGVSVDAEHEERS